MVPLSLVVLTRGSHVLVAIGSIAALHFLGMSVSYLVRISEVGEQYNCAVGIITCYFYRIVSVIKNPFQRHSVFVIEIIVSVVNVGWNRSQGKFVVHLFAQCVS